MISTSMPLAPAPIGHAVLYGLRMRYYVGVALVTAVPGTADRSGSARDDGAHRLAEEPYPL